MYARRILVAVAAAAAAAAGVADAANTVTKHATRTFALAPGTTRTFDVGYPDALEFGGAVYRGLVAILPPAAGSAGGAPSLGKVKVLAEGSALGGSDFRVRVRNANPAGTAAVEVRVTAVTHEPAH